MPTTGLFLLTLGALLIRQVWVGRVSETPQDLRDISLALLSGDSAKMREVMSLRGENVTVSAGSEVATTADTVAPSSSLLSEAISLGSKATGYSYGATGPTTYDCSGLVWKATKALGIYKGARFTTSTADAVFPKFATKVTTRQVGDIVLWPGKHMGIVSGADSYYSARSTEKGIGYSSLSGDIAYFAGIAPEYWRVNNG